MQFQIIPPHYVADPRAVTSAPESWGSPTGSTVTQKHSQLGFGVDPEEGMGQAGQGQKVGDSPPKNSQNFESKSSTHEKECFVTLKVFLKYIPYNPSKAAHAEIFREKAQQNLTIHDHTTVQPPEKRESQHLLTDEHEAQ